MRVITGIARGRRLLAPEGNGTRPTTEKVKEALFSAIQFNIDGKSVLDLFAGSGQLGIEALSRGASRCTFIESDRAAADIVKKNVTSVGFASQSLISSMDALMFLEHSYEKFGIIFLDPPYKKDFISSVAERISKVSDENTIIVCETSKTEELPETMANLPISFDRCYGDIRIRIYRKSEDTIY